MSYEPQQILEVKNIALAPNKQNTFLTPVAAPSYTARPRNPGTSFAAITKQYYSDEAMANKGHQWPTFKTPIEQMTAFDATFDVDNFLAGWLLAFSMGAVTVVGAGPWTHTFKFLQSTNQMPVTSILFQDTNDVIYQFPDIAIADLIFTGKEMGPIQAQFKSVGGGRWVDGAVAFPALAQQSYLFGSDADILLGPPQPTVQDMAGFVLSTVVAGALAQHTDFFRVTWQTAAGETLAGPEISILVPANSVGKIVAPAVFPLGVISCNIYGSNATGTETKVATAVAAAGNFQEPNAGLVAGAALPTATSALSSIHERIVQWDVHLAQNMVPNRAPGGGLNATFMKVLKQRATTTLQVKATSADDMRTLFINDTPRELQINTNSGAAQALKFQFPGLYFTAQLSASGEEEVWTMTAGDQDVIKNTPQEVFQAVVINNTPAYMVGA